MSESSVNSPSSPKHPEQGSQISPAVEELTRGFQAELGRLAERVATAARGEFADGLVRTLARLDGQLSQGALLNVLLSEARQFASRTAFFLTRPEGVRCWSSAGFVPEVAQALDGIQISYGSDQAWASLAEGKGVVLLSAESCRALTGKVDAEAATSGVLVPFVLRGQLGGALYADQTEAGPGLVVGALQLLAHTAAQALETLSIRGGSGSPSLRFAEMESHAIPLWNGQAAAAPGAAPEDAASAEAAVPVEAAPEPETSGPETPEAGPDTGEATEEDSTLAGAAMAGLGAVAGAVAAGADLVAGALGVETSEESEPAAVASEDAEAEPEPAEATFSSSPSDTVDLLETPDFDTAATPIYASASETAEAPPEVAVSPGATELALPDLADPGIAAPDAMDAIEPDVGTMPEPAIPEVAAPEVAAEAALPELAGSEMLSSEYLPAEPEPEKEDLDDTASSLWDLEEDDEDATAVTAVAPAQEPEPSRDVPSLEAPPIVAAPEALPGPTIPAVQSPPSLTTIPDSLVGQQTVRLDVAALQQARAAKASDQESTLDTQQASAAAAWQSPPEPADVPPVGDSEDPTLMVSRDQLLPAQPPPELTPPAPPLGVGFGAPSTQVSPPPAKPASTSSEVVPPEDVKGPGSAFGSSSHVPEGEQALHEEARRLARLLVSEIKLYNEDQIALGRRDSNIYERLKDDIDRSRQMYEERIHERIRNSEDYFYHELVQRLADGNASLLGI